MLRLPSSFPRIGRWPRLLLAGCCVLLALASAVRRKPAAEAVTRTVPVIVAAHDLPAGHLLGRADLAVLRWPRSVRPAAARGDPAALLGQRLAGPVGDGEPITGTRLVGTDLATGLPPRFVAAAVALADDHAVELVRAGDRVDLLESERPVDPLAAEPSASTPPAETTELATHARVLAVLPATPAADAELVLAVDRPTAMRITRDTATHLFTAVVIPP